MFKSLFTKNYKVSNSSKIRTKYGVFASVYGIVTNLVLCCTTFIVGFLSGSVALISEAINSLSDGISSIITLVGFKISNKPADKKHPFGYERFEYISALIISFIICFIGAMLSKTSIDKIISPHHIEVSWLMLVVLGFAVIVKISQFMLYSRIGKLIDSESINANKVDTRNDACVSFLTLVALAIMWLFNVDIDAYIGLAVSLFIVVSGFKVLLDSIKPLIGEKPDKELVDKIKRKLDSFDGILSYHELIIHSYGKGTNFVSVHIEVSADADPLDIHKLVDKIETAFLKDLKIHLVVHTDPVDNNNKTVSALKAKTQSTLSKLNKKIIVNDFHVTETKKYVYITFDCSVPYETGISKTKIVNRLKDEFENTEKTYKFNIDIDRDFI